MKRETYNHPKTLDLAARLDVPQYAAVGLLGTLWNWVPDYALAGNVGKYPNGTIARSCGWTGDADKFVQALIDAGWLDRDDEHRLIVHDWAQHVENWIRAKAAKANVILLGAAKPPARPAPSPAAANPPNRQKPPAQPHKSEQNATSDGNMSPGLKSHSSPCDQSNPIQSNPPPPTPTRPDLNPAPVRTSTGEPVTWAEAAEGMKLLKVSRIQRAIAAAQENGFTPPQVLSLVDTLRAVPSSLCTSPAGALYDRLTTPHAADWDATENWPWQSPEGSPTPSPYVTPPAVARQMADQNEQERMERARRYTEEQFRLETTHGATLNAMDDSAVLALIANEPATLRKTYQAKGRDSPDVRTCLLQVIDKQAN